MSSHAQPAAGGDRILPFEAVERTLPNGLKVIVGPTGFPNIVSLQIPVQTGSRNEVEPGKPGFAHFLEHMMFRGTKAYPPEAYQAILTKAGGAAERVHDRRLHEPRSRPSRARCSASTTRQRRPDPEALRGPARERVRGPHLPPHDDGLPQGHRGHAQPVRS